MTDETRDGETGATAPEIRAWIAQTRELAEAEPLTDLAAALHAAADEVEQLVDAPRSGAPGS